MRLLNIRAAAVLSAAALLLLSGGFPEADALELSAQKAVLMDADSGRVLYARNAYDRALIASTTKIMTALVVCEQCNVLDQVEIPAEAAGIEGSSMYLKAGERLTVQELLYGLMLHSGNDAAMALAIYCGGTVEGFVDMMNDTAARLHLDNTHFQNPSGLDAESHYSTAYDLARLMAYAMNDPIFAATAGTRSVRVGDRALTNHNKLLWRCEGVDGGKTGYTKAAGRILVSTASREGRRLIAVTIRASDDWRDHEALYQMGFSTYSRTLICSAGQKLMTLPVWGGGSISLEARQEASCTVGPGETITLHYPGPGFLFAMPQEGESAGFIYAAVDGRTAAKIPVCYGKPEE